MRRIRQAVPVRVREAWRHLDRRGTRYRIEDAMAGAAAWIAQHGASHGFRPPSLGERARTMG
eukprot:11214614-Lingulodinium_polyedra.AAC.1